jgi:hypothetical protein
MAEWMRKLIGILLLLWLGAGCAQFPTFGVVNPGQECRALRVKSTSQCDYFQYLNDKGRITQLGYDTDADGTPDVAVNLSAMNEDGQNPHYVILLDGIPYDLVQAMYAEGHFRLFYPPSKVIGPFPSMTDVAYTELFLPVELLGFEALYYNRGTHKLSDGDRVYLNGGNELWAKRVDYRVPMWLDPVGYACPGFLFDHELAAIEKMMNRRRCGTAIGYSVGTATVGTRKGEAGLRKCLRDVERLCEKIVYERRGRCRITLMADHGHNLTPGIFFDMSAAVKVCGYHPAKRLRNSNDVVVIEFGLVTNSAMYTGDPDGVARALVDGYDEVNLAVYPLAVGGERKVVVRSRDGLAYVSKVDGGYRYEMVRGDPLKLAGKVDVTGVMNDRALFDATVDHDYPDPLARVWGAFDGMVRYPADLVVTVKDGWFCGKPSFARSVSVASTHGSLNRQNTETFVMTTIKPLPAAMRMGEVPAAVPDFLTNGKNEGASR